MDERTHRKVDEDGSLGSELSDLRTEQPTQQAAQASEVAPHGDQAVTSPISVVDQTSPTEKTVGSGDEFMLSVSEDDGQKYSVDEEKFLELQDVARGDVRSYLAAHVKVFELNKLKFPDDQPLTGKEEFLLNRQEKLENNLENGVKAILRLFDESQISKASEVNDLAGLYLSRFRQTQAHRIKEMLKGGESTASIVNIYSIFDNLNNVYFSADDYEPPVTSSRGGEYKQSGGIGLEYAKLALQLSGLNPEEKGAGEAATSIFTRAQLGSGLSLFTITYYLKNTPDDPNKLKLDDFINCTEKLRNQLAGLMAAQSRGRGGYAPFDYSKDYNATKWTGANDRLIQRAPSEDYSDEWTGFRPTD